MRGNWMRVVTAAASVAALAGAVGLPATLVVGGHVRVPRLATPPTVSRSVVHALPGAIALSPASKASAHRLTTRPAPVVAQLVSAPVAQPRPHPVAPARPQP